MKKFAAITLLGFAIVSLTAACTPSGSENFSRATVAVGGDQFDCIFEYRGTTTGTMSCTQLPVGNATGVSEDTKGFSRETITVGGDQFDCIFEYRGTTSGTMSCTPLAV